jgi:hypothetical protein
MTDGQGRIADLTAPKAGVGRLLAHATAL